VSDKLLLMPWYKITLSHEDIAALKHMALQESFANIVVVHGAPRDAAMFSDTAIGVHEYYFSPGATKIATALLAGYSAVACVAPTRSSLHLLVGHDGAEAIPFAPEA
jgi:hypothetical protein